MTEKSPLAQSVYRSEQGLSKCSRMRNTARKVPKRVVVLPDQAPPKRLILLFVDLAAHQPQLFAFR